MKYLFFLFFSPSVAIRRVVRYSLFTPLQNNKITEIHVSTASKVLQTHLSSLVWEQTEDVIVFFFLVRSIMTPPYLAALMVVAAGLLHTVAGLSCPAGCVACWKDNDTHGVDTKWSCPQVAGRWQDCGSGCPPGYNGLHCADGKRCRYVVFFFDC